MSRAPRIGPTIAALGLAFFVAGCNQPTGSTAPRSRAPVVSADPGPIAADPPAPAPVVDTSKPREILGKRTQDIREFDKESKAGGVENKGKITAKDPITMPGNAYVSIVGRNSVLNIQHALDLYKAETGEFPKTYDEFMDKIIKANNIVLPTLPFYQEYTYDVAEHRLAIMEYPDRKEKANYPK